MPMVYYVMKKINVSTNDEDYLQLGRIAIYEAWCKFDPLKGEFAPYVYSYIYGKLLKNKLNESKWYNHHPSYDTQILENVCHSNSNEMEVYHLLDLLKRSHLSEKEKCWVIEGVINQNKPSEIAEKYQCSVHTVKTWRRNALIKLHNYYGAVLKK